MRGRGTRSSSTNQNFGNNESVMWKNIQRNQNLLSCSDSGNFNFRFAEEQRGKNVLVPAALRLQVNTSAQRHKSSVFLRVHERLKHASRPPARDCRRPRSSNINAAASAAQERSASVSGTRVLRTIKQPAAAARSTEEEAAVEAVHERALTDSPSHGLLGLLLLLSPPRSSAE